MLLNRRRRRVAARCGEVACAEALEQRVLLAAFMYSELPLLEGSTLRPTGVGDDGIIWGEYDGGFFLMLDHREAAFDQHGPFPEFAGTGSPLEAGERIIDADGDLFFNSFDGDLYSLHLLVADDEAGTNPALISVGPDAPPRRIELTGLPESGAPAGSTFGPIRGIASNSRGDVVLERTRTDANGTVASTWLYRDGTLFYIFDGSPIGINDADTIVANGPDGHVWTWSSGVGVFDLGEFVATGFSNTADHSLGTSFVFGYDASSPGEVMLARRPTTYLPGQGPPGSPTEPGPVTLHTLGGPSGAVSVRPTTYGVTLTGSYVDGDGRTRGFTTDIIDFTSGTPVTTFSDLNGTVLNAPAGFDTNDVEYLAHDFGTIVYGSYPNQTHVSENQFYLGRRGPDGVAFILGNVLNGVVYVSDLNTYTNHNNASAERALEFSVHSVTYGAAFRIAVMDSGGADVLTVDGVAGGPEVQRVLTDGVQALADGEYTYELRVLVEGAVVYTTPSRDFVIDTVAPVFTSTAPTSASVSYEYDPQTDAELVDSQMSYSIFADTPGIAGSWTSFLFNSPGEVFTYHPSASFLGTPVSFTIRARDRAGNTTDQTITFTVDGVATYFPEGFTGETIDEFLAVVNPHDHAVNYRVNVWYEGFTGSTLAGEGTVAANSRGGVTVSTRETWSHGPISHGAPYAFEMISDAPLVTSISHYDFGSATSETFTDQLSTSWILPAGRVEENVRDFIVWFNPSNDGAALSIDFFDEDGTLLETLRTSTPAHQRGGLDVSGVKLPDGRYTVVITSDQHIVASLTQYLTEDHADGPAAFMALGVADGGAVEGALPLVVADGTSGLRIHNPAGGIAEGVASEATIVLTFTDEAGGTVTHTMMVAAGDTTTLSLGDVAGLTPGARYSVAYESDSPVAMVAVQRVHEDLIATPLVDLDHAAAGYHFADGFMNPDRAGVDVFETVSIYNPDATAAVEATITLRFTDGFELTTMVQIEAGRAMHVDLHEWEELLEQGRDFDRFFYSVQVEADGPVIAGMWHFDLTLGGDTPAGGFAVLGAPVNGGTAV